MNILSRHLSKDQITAIHLYIQREAREVDRAFHFFRQGEGTSEKVIQALQHYQNADGGFGHALEPDSRLLDSSVLNTTIALQFLVQLPIDGHHPMIKQTFDYLTKQFDDINGRWSNVPVTINHVPRAPWWNVNEETGETGFENTPGNPAAEILGYFHFYRDQTSSDLIEKVETSVMKRWDEIEEWDMHEVQCYYRLAQLTDQEEIRMRILSKMSLHLHDIFALSKDQWSSYGLQPLALINQTTSFLYKELEDVVEENAYWYAEQLSKEGCFEPTWEWGQYPLEWKQAKKEWSSYLTVTACHPFKI
ncbi:prenyltransferase/squalene oxidase repeat-containing protein [Jeotgalibacillus campisalis]|uniref:Uncharacterized protein n=1 Tax=Jeotgalibacillus campisalis TaxID=220754 RepID=A0A0C2W807_9BACL|nr:hypothetical protein [Jeotgalibacillus campisalis]KIL52716.1 hypothetical protein KR50_00450 [Jeotgalibacillus campisalis]